MIDEPADADSRTVDPLAAWLDRPFTELTVDELMALKAELEKRGVRIYDNHRLLSMPEVVALATPIAVYSKAFLETLAKHHADAVADLLRRSTRKNGTTTEAEIGMDGDAAAKIIVTADMPDEARLALLDLDVTDDAVRGKVLRWDSSASAWRPDDES
jgi:hypothetical protein